MRAVNLQNSIFGIGCALILFSIWFSINVTFPPVQLTEGEAWVFGPRAAAHLIGFAGILMAGWFFINSFSYMSSKALIIFTATLSMSLLVVLWLASGTWGLIRPDVAKLVCIMLIYALGACGMASILRRHWPKVLEPAPALLIAVVGSLCMSLDWEGITQNLSNVYDGPARGFMQGAQITCDMLGITLGALGVAYFQHQRCRR